MGIPSGGDVQFYDLHIEHAGRMAGESRAVQRRLVGLTTRIPQISIAGSIIVNQGFVNRFGDQSGEGVYALNTNWVSAWAAIINVGQMCAITTIPYVANRYGRKVAFICCWVAFIICLIFLTVAKVPAVWLLGKLFVGIAAGTAQMTTGPYMVEISPNRIRGGINTFSVGPGASERRSICADAL